MRLLTYLIIAIVALYIGYKIAEITINNRRISKNIQPLIDKLKVELVEIDGRLKQINLTNQQKAELEEQKNKIIEMLGSFYGYSIEEMNKFLS